MKKLLLVFLGCIVFVMICFSYAFHKVFDFDNNHNISIRVKENDETYSIYASYARSRSRRIQHYIDQELHTNHLFTNSRIDATMTLDDKTNLYVRTTPGKLYIRLNRQENDEAAYLRIKRLGEGIKQRLGQD